MKYKTVTADECALNAAQSLSRIGTSINCPVFELFVFELVASAVFDACLDPFSESKPRLVAGCGTGSGFFPRPYRQICPWNNQRQKTVEGENWKN